MTTFKNWASEVQIYMSLDDHNLTTLMDKVKTEKVPINDANYIDHQLHEQGLGHGDGEKCEHMRYNDFYEYIRREQSL
eukprot:6426480-Amphidinium_carterae.1